MKVIEKLLRERLGFEPRALGNSLLERSVRARMRAAGLADMDQYAQLLAHSAEEWNEFLEAAVVTETWFFRERETFAAFMRLVSERWMPTHAGAQLRILSLPCSSGEEPYSLSMALLDAEIPRFHIDAVDISGQAIARARKAAYRKNSFRGANLLFQRRYFTARNGTFLLEGRIKAAVHFEQGNILDETFCKRAPYDFIFCRNLLIYLDAAARERALKTLGRLLAPNAFLFVAPAEESLLVQHGFTSTRIRTGCAFQAPGMNAATARAVTAPNLPASSSLHPTCPDMGLTKARQLADTGYFGEAWQACHAHINAHGASAQAFCLLGLLKEARREAGAAEMYRKALYLDPQHYPALLQMAVLSRKSGQPGHAQAYTLRAERARAGL